MRFLGCTAAVTVFLFFVSVNPVSAEVVVDPSIATSSAIVPNTIGAEDLTPGKISISPSLGRFVTQAHQDSQGSISSVQGLGGTLEGSYSFNSHLGVELALSGFSGKGTYTAGPSETPNPNIIIPTGTSGACSVSGGSALLALILDPFSGDGFRLPFTLGLNYLNLSSHTPTNGSITSVSLSSPGFTIGLSPRFNIAFLRIQPFIVISSPLQKANITCAPGIDAQYCTPIPFTPIPVVGVNLIFRPWDLSFYVNVSELLIKTGSVFYSMGPRFSF